ncbi:MAG TPA: hypothetical protein VJS92_14870 [Candidatus Polarisedimenticolaceae bacterium]|nr:hypothetical protein [Candidatus Polarisedimenticolaceae bacterium]
MSRTVRFALAGVAALGLLVAAGISSYEAKAADKAGPMASKAQKSRGEGKDENIKKAGVSNNANSTAVAPPSKGGDKSRGGICSLHVNNYTKWYIIVYGNGDQIGTVGPYGDLWAVATEGRMNLYAKAPFDDGSSYTWGPQVATCTGQDVEWKLED